jgi:hypothetical protein
LSSKDDYTNVESRDSKTVYGEISEPVRKILKDHDVDSIFRRMVARSKPEEINNKSK